MIATEKNDNTCTYIQISTPWFQKCWK